MKTDLGTIALCNKPEVKSHASVPLFPPHPKEIFLDMGRISSDFSDGSMHILNDEFNISEGELGQHCEPGEHQG